MNDNVYLPYQDMIPDIVDGLTPIQRVVFNAVKILDDTGMLQYVQTIFKGLVQTAYIVGCAIDRKIDIETPYDNIIDAVLKYPLSDIYYDEIIRLAAEWQKPYPLIEYRGNFGTLQGDLPASMLYTQIKQSDFAKFATREPSWIDYDIKKCSELNTTLPFRIPNLLINGFVLPGEHLCAAFFAPHNIIETCDAVLAYLRNPRISLQKLMTYLKGPDFPTGGLIESDSLLEIYKTGCGDIDVFADVVLEDSLISDDDAENISRLYFRTPYMADFMQIEQELDLIISSHSINGLVNARYEHKDFLNQGFCVDIEKSADIIAVIKEIYNMTHLKNRIAINNLAYVDGVPQRLNLKDMIRFWVSKRVQAIASYFPEGGIVPKGILKLDLRDTKEIYQAPRKTQIIHSIDDYLSTFSCHNLA